MQKRDSTKKTTKKEPKSAVVCFYNMKNMFNFAKSTKNK